MAANVVVNCSHRSNTNTKIKCPLCLYLYNNKTNKFKLHTRLYDDEEFLITFTADLCIMCVSKFNELLIVKFTLTNHWWVRYNNYHWCDGLSHYHYVFLSAFTQV